MKNTRNREEAGWLVRVRTNEGDVVQVWREDQAGEEQKKTGGKTLKTQMFQI